jgi:type III restriction enzyme
MLLQAERKSKTEKTLHAEEVKKLLIDSFQQAEEHIAIATGESNELDGLNLFARDCPVRFIITQAKLREGWDCSFAYVLCSVAEQKSATAVEQLLGRVLRMPAASRKKRDELNRAYAFATTTSFHAAANTLKDGLVNNGFERIEADALVRADADAFPGFGEDRAAFVHDEALPQELDFEAVKAILEPATGGRVEINVQSGRIIARGALTDVDRKTLIMAVESAGGRENARAWTEAFVHKTRGARLATRIAEAADRSFSVPRLIVTRNGRKELFDRVHFLDIPWALETCDPGPILDHFIPPSKLADQALVDVTKEGKATIFYDSLQLHLSLMMEERNWTKPALANWIDRKLPQAARRDITKVSSTLFISKALDLIMSKQGMTLEGLARAKFRIVDALVKVIATHRDERERTAFEQAVMFPQSGLEFETNAYNQPYRGATVFQKHFARVVGDLDCAVHIDRLPEVKVWARNSVRQKNSFWLQTSSDKFYPDFVCKLQDGRVLVVEYKGKLLAPDPAEQQKKLIGELWADRSRGRCLFAWVENKQYPQIDQTVRSSDAGRCLSS